MKSEARGRSDLIILKSARALMNKTIFRKIYSRDYAEYTRLSDSESQLSGKVLVYTQLTRYTYGCGG